MIDRQKLLQMMDGDEAMVAKFIDGFKRQVSQQLPLMQDYLRTENRELLSNLVHVLKTQTAYLGLDDLSAQAQEIERLIDDGQTLELIKPACDILARELAKVIAESEEGWGKN